MIARNDDGVAVSRIGSLVGALTAVLALGIHHAQAVAPVTGSVEDVVQVLADLTAIDVECRDLAVNYGVGFRYAADLGVAPATVMPTGSRHAAFEKALRETEAAYDPVIVCGTLARHYSVVLPGSINFPPASRDGS